MTLPNQNLQFAAGSTYEATVDITGMPDGRTITKASYAVLDPATNQVLLLKTDQSGITISQQPPSAQLKISFVPADTRDLLGVFDHQVRVEDDLGGQAPPVTTGTLTLQVGTSMGA